MSQEKLTVYMRVNNFWKDANYYYFLGKITRRENHKVASVTSYISVKIAVNNVHTTPSKGDYWKITGVYSYQKESYGNGYIRTRIYFNNPSTFEQTMPNTHDELIEFVSKRKEFTGLGSVKMREACEKLQQDMLPAILNKDKERLSTVLPRKLVDNLLEGFEHFDNLKHSLWMAKYHIPPFIQQKVFKLNKSFNPKDIENNPYELITLGLSFEQADDIAINQFGFTLNHPFRLTGAVNEALNIISNWGHTVATHNQIMLLIQKRLKLCTNDTGLALKALDVAFTSKKFSFTERNGYYHHGVYFFMEKVIALRFKTMLLQKAEWSDLHPEAINKAMADNLFPLAEKQVEAVFTALESNLSVIIGGAGTGKTTVLRTVLRSFKELGYDIHPIALAGKAAMRLRHSIGFKTSTIACFLGQAPLIKGKNVIVIDEASMVDLATMFELVLHCSPDVRFVLVGDDDQLASIGVGLVLSDLIRSLVVPSVELDIIQRQDRSTGIPSYSALVRQGIVPPALTTGNIHVHDCDVSRVVEICAQLYAKDPGNTQIITATNNTKDAVNRLCQSTFNATGEPMLIEMGGEIFYTKYRLNDPVIFTKNNYDIDIQNGTLGRLVKIKTDESKGAFGEVKAENRSENVGLIIELMDHLDLAYGITLHKGQGSQFRRVIVAIDNTKLIDRSWIYTAITRAEVELHLVGSKKKLINAIKGGSAKYTRQTYLTELLQEEIAVN